VAVSSGPRHTIITVDVPRHNAPRRSVLRLVEGRVISGNTVYDLPSVCLVSKGDCWASVQVCALLSALLVNLCSRIIVYIDLMFM